MACERFRDALTDVAAGAPAPALVQDHLAACAACRAELDARRRALAVADAEMAGLLATEPSTGLAARIRTAVAEAEPSPSPAGRFGWLWPATAAAATLLVALAVWVGRGPSPLPETRVAVEAPRPSPVIPSQDLRPPCPEGSAIPANSSSPGSSGSPLSARMAAARQGRRPVPAQAVPREPEVLVPPGEAEALLRFATIVHRDRHTPGAFLAAGRPSPDLAEPAALDVTPLEIVPLDPAETPGT